MTDPIALLTDDVRDYLAELEQTGVRTPHASIKIDFSPIGDMRLATYAFVFLGSQVVALGVSLDIEQAIRDARIEFGLWRGEREVEAIELETVQ